MSDQTEATWQRWQLMRDPEVFHREATSYDWRSLMDIAEAVKAREEAWRPRHRCEVVAVAQWNDVGGRANWIGRLLEPVPGWEEETHCLHLKTPLKGEIVLLCMEDDFYQFAALCQAAIKDPIDPEYFRVKAQSYVGNVRNLREAGVPEALAASEPPGTARQSLGEEGT